MDDMFRPLVRYADFRGRSRRREYWMYSLFVWLLYLVIGGLMFAFLGTELFALAQGGSPLALLGSTPVLIIGVVFVLIYLVLLIPSLAVGVRRMHDTERSGSWIVAPIALSMMNIVATMVGLPLVFSLASWVVSLSVFVFSLLQGTRGFNRFGPDPKGADGDLADVFN